MSQGQSFGLQHGYKSTTADWHTTKDPGRNYPLLPTLQARRPSQRRRSPLHPRR